MKVAIFGAGGHGRVVADLLTRQKSHQLVGYLDDDKTKWGRRGSSIPVLGGRELLTAKGRRPFQGVLLAIGDGATRQQIAELCENNRLKLVGFRHPSAVVSKQAVVDPSAMIWPQAVVQVGATIGKGVIVNTGAIIEHDTRIGDYAFIAPGAVVCGYCQVGQRSWIGAGAVVINTKKVGSDTVIGAGAVVVSDFGDRLKAYGVPCRAR